MQQKAEERGERDIVVKLKGTRFFLRLPCHVCGGCTEKPSVLAEAELDCGHEFRVCEFCLKTGDIDGQLAEYAAGLEEAAAAKRALIGRLRVPSYAAYQAFTDQWEAEEAEARDDMREDVDCEQDSIPF